MKRTANAIWRGSIKEGNGKLSTQSTTLNNAQYSYKSRFEDGVGTNPDELLAAAHAGCFVMALSLILGEAGYKPDSLDVVATITFETAKLNLESSHLKLSAKIPGISQEKFMECAEGAKANCPISKALSLQITLDATLE